MVKIKSVLIILFFLSFLMPSYRVIAQENISTNQQTILQTDENNDNADIKEKKSDKKKKKNKEINIVEWASTFFWYLLVNISTLLLIIIFVYYPNNKQKETIFTFLMFNLMIFMITIVLNKVKISMGAAFGLFAVFSMLRYRTEGISMKDMTYLFIFIAIGLISAIQLEYLQLIVINSVIVLFTLVLDSKIFFKRENCRRIEYENIDLVKPENFELLIEDLKKRTGLNIQRIQIDKINYLKDTADIKIYYYE